MCFLVLFIFDFKDGVIFFRKFIVGWMLILYVMLLLCVLGLVIVNWCDVSLVLLFFCIISCLILFIMGGWLFIGRIIVIILIVINMDRK